MTEETVVPAAPETGRNDRPRPGRRALVLGAAAAGVLALAGGIAFRLVHREATRDGSAVLALSLPEFQLH